MYGLKQPLKYTAACVEITVVGASFWAKQLAFSSFFLKLIRLSDLETSQQHTIATKSTTKAK